MNVFLYYKALTIRLDDIVAIIFQKTITLPCQGRGKCLQLPQLNAPSKELNEEYRVASVASLIAPANPRRQGGGELHA